MPITQAEGILAICWHSGIKLELDILKDINKIQHIYDEEHFCNVSLTALIAAAQKGHLQFIQPLIDNEAKVNMGDKNNRTAIHWACQKGNLDVVKLLVENGIEVNKGNDEGYTALHAACLHRFYSIHLLDLQEV